ncbi:MAG: hypothetical protein ACON4R_01425 [Akkermansiaceae bacterium]
MKIEIVTDTYHPDVNGVAMTLGRLVKGIKEKGHEVYVMHTALGDAAEEETQMRGGVECGGRFSFVRRRPQCG